MIKENKKTRNTKTEIISFQKKEKNPYLGVTFTFINMKYF